MMLKTIGLWNVKEDRKKETGGVNLGGVAQIRELCVSLKVDQ